MPALAAAGYRAVAVDLANFGLSDKSWDLDTRHAAQADLVAAVMDARGISRATLVGHSMGGNVLAWFAARHADRLDGAVLVDAATGPAASGGGPAFVGSLVRLPNVRRIGQLVLRSQLDEARMADILRSAYADPSRVTTEDVSATPPRSRPSTGTWGCSRSCATAATALSTRPSGRSCASPP